MKFKKSIDSALKKTSDPSYSYFCNQPFNRLPLCALAISKNNRRGGALAPPNNSLMPPSNILNTHKTLGEPIVLRKVAFELIGVT